MRTRVWVVVVDRAETRLVVLRRLALCRRGVLPLVWLVFKWLEACLAWFNGGLVFVEVDGPTYM